MLDARNRFGTLAERTSKQPGRARLTTRACRLFHAGARKAWRTTL